MVRFRFMGPFKKFMGELDSEGLWHQENIDGMTIGEFLDNTEVKNHFMNYSLQANNQNCERDYIMKDGDIIRVIPIFSAG